MKLQIGIRIGGSIPTNNLWRIAMKPRKNHGVNLLGHEVEDPVSGLRGIAEAKITFMNNNVRYSIQPKSKDKSKIENGYDIDEHQLKVIGAGVSHLRIDPPANISVDVGREVKDIVSNCTGVLTEKHESLNGCVYFVLTTKKTDKQESMQTKLTYERLIPVGKGVTANILEAQEKAHTTAASTAEKPKHRQGLGAPTTRRVRS